MKKLAILLPFALLTACAPATNNQSNVTNTQHEHTTHQHNQMQNNVVAQAPVASNTVERAYACEGNGQIISRANENSARISATIPQLNLINQEIELEITRSGSGVLYVNKQNPENVIQWFLKGDQYGLFEVSFADGRNLTINCDAI
ncbi:MliC family protein [Rappaport israeli]|uniref:MliC family protein n=1 Tax=Rappaport israeli TaxID=1839807 RepID=UPI0009316D65|nr:MliC family protein [Rappaport israeli]